MLSPGLTFLSISLSVAFLYWTLVLWISYIVGGNGKTIWYWGVEVYSSSLKFIFIIGSLKKNFYFRLATAAIYFSLSLMSRWRSDLNFSLTKSYFGEYFFAERLMISRIHIATIGFLDFSNGFRTFITRLQIYKSFWLVIYFSFRWT